MHLGQRSTHDQPLEEYELVVTGKEFRRMIQNGQIDDFLLSIRVFARMSPTDKVSVFQIECWYDCVRVCCIENDCRCCIRRQCTDVGVLPVRKPW